MIRALAARLGAAARRRELVIAFASLLGGTAATLAGPALVGYAIDHALLARDERTLAAVALAFLLTAGVGAVLSREAIRRVGAIGERLLYALRVETFAHLQRLSLEFYESERTGTVVSRLTADFDAMEDLVQQGLLVLVTNAVVFVVAVAILLALSWQLFLVVLVAAPGLALASRRFHREARPAYHAVRERIGQTLAAVQEGLSGVRVVQAFGREEQQVERFSSRNRAQLEANLGAVRVSVRYFPVVEGSSVLTTAVIVGAGGALARTGLVEVGTVVAFVLYVSSLFDPVQQMSQLLNQFQSSAAALRRVLGVLGTPPSVEEAPEARELPRRGALCFDGVSYAYPVPGAGGSRRAALEEVSLRIEQGERVALVGPTGAGKSTLAKLAVRFVDPISGTVSFAGVDLRLARLSSLRDRIVLVPQEGFVFRGTVLDNVRLARPEASEDEVRAALASIGALERFERSPGGLGRVVAERGALLSAGERQLLSLARVALADPAVLVLDEATSALDPGTEHAVEEALRRLGEGRTTIVIAHRLSSARRADRVVVVDGGRIAEVGTHDELRRRGGRYAALDEAWRAGGAA